MTSAAATPRTLVWDLGGVVLRWEPVELVREALSRRLPGQDPARLTARLFGGFAAGGFWEQFDRGLIGRDQVAEHMAAGAGLKLSDVSRVLDSVGPHLALRPDTVALVHRVRTAGHRAVYLSNMPEPYVADLNPLLGPLFDDGLFSCHVGEVKPEPQIFEDAERRLGLDPENLLFLDDREPNVDAAREFGWPAVLFTSPGTCADELKGLGWL